MDFYHKQVLRLACLVTGEKELGQFTLHRAILQLLGYDWWDSGSWSVGWVLKCVIYPMVYFLLLIIVSFLTGLHCFNLDVTDNLEFLIFMNNIIVIFTVMFAAFKTLYMKLLFGRETKELISLLMELGDLKEGRPAWESSLTAFTYYLCLLLNICLLWTVYDLVRYGVFSYQTAYPWDQHTPVGWCSALFFSFNAAFFTALIHSSLDSIVSVSCGVLCAHMVNLKNLLDQIGRPGVHDWQLLVSAVQLHVKLIRASSKMNRCFNVLFAFQSVYTVLHACVLIFTFVKAHDVVGAIANTLPMLLASYFQLFMYCFYGQKLTSSFEGLTFHCYNNEWYRSRGDVQRGLLLMSLISRRVVAVRGLGHSVASYATYLSSVQESISYYLILKTITAGENKKHK